ncbi:hypothetical protein NQZ68_020611 [Dissostichus eleginoides]|nr:hypothetical protein NQZ68_020611 [Dissostichus eleginoides]
MKEHVSLWAKKERTNKTWYFGLSALALCTRTVVIIGKLRHQTPQKKTKSPRNAFFDQVSLREVTDYDLLTQPKTRRESSVRRRGREPPLSGGNPSPSQSAGEGSSGPQPARTMTALQD